MAIQHRTSEKRMEEPVRYAIIEIGAGGAPVHMVSETVRDKIKNGALYVALDINRSRLKLLEGEDHPILGDFSDLPFLDGSADEIWLMNVFGGDIGNASGKMAVASYIRSVKGYFHELVRVLRPHGMVYIGETYTPVDPVDWLTNYDYGSLGLKKNIYAGERLKEFLREQRIDPTPYGVKTLLSGIDPFSDANPFFITLRRT